MIGGTSSRQSGCQPLPRQGDAGDKLMMMITVHADERYSLSPEQIADVQRSIHDADRGELASDEEIDELWRVCGL
jgi:hypothetical protein